MIGKLFASVPGQRPVKLAGQPHKKAARRNARVISFGLGVRRSAGPFARFIANLRLVLKTMAAGAISRSRRLALGVGGTRAGYTQRSVGLSAIFGLIMIMIMISVTVTVVA
jgi:hypothetical protein